MKVQVLALSVFLATNLGGIVFCSQRTSGNSTQPHQSPLIKNNQTARHSKGAGTSQTSGTTLKPAQKSKTTTGRPAGTKTSPKPKPTTPHDDTVSTRKPAGTKTSPKPKPTTPRDDTVSTRKPAGTKTSPKPKPTTPHNDTVSTRKPTEITCEMRNDTCSKCIGGDSCVYCSSDHSCYKKKGIIPSGCKWNRWYWKQCKIPGNILIIIIPTVGGVLLIMVGCCIYCCCCRHRGRNRATREETRQQQRRVDREERNAQRRHDRKARHDAIRMKYGLLQNVDDDESEALA